MSEQIKVEFSGKNCKIYPGKAQSKYDEKCSNQSKKSAGVRKNNATNTKKQNN